MFKICQKCGHPNKDATRDPSSACPECGHPYWEQVNVSPAVEAPTEPAFVAPTESLSESPREKKMDEKFCSECGSIIKAKAEICPKCGVRQMPPPQVQSSPIGKVSAEGKNKLVAGLLALFLGGLGIHKFYLGKGIQGLLYLVFCWTFIPAVVGFVEGINYLLMSEETFFKRYAA